jgi:WhiB family redox-sensing transcriptional regulator
VVPLWTVVNNATTRPAPTLTATRVDPPTTDAFEVDRDVDVSAGAEPASLVTMTLLDLPDVAFEGSVTQTFVESLDDLDEPFADELDDELDGETATGTSFARCADGNGTLAHLFFSEDEFDIARAKAICGKCGLAATCLAGALDRAEVYGVWGGELLVDGQIVAVKRGRGRPPKTPRPPLIVDEVPLPPHLVA